MDKITHIVENVVRCKYFEAGVHIKNPMKNSYQDGLGRTTQTLDHVVLVHILIWDKRKSQINIYNDHWLWHSLSNSASSLPLGGEPDASSSIPWNIIHSLSCRNPYRLFIYNILFGSSSLDLLVWSELGRSLPFWPMRNLRMLGLQCRVWSCPKCIVLKPQSNLGSWPPLTCGSVPRTTSRRRTWTCVEGCKEFLHY